MEVGASGPTGHTDVADDLTCLNGLIESDGEIFEVSIDRV